MFTNLVFLFVNISNIFFLKSLGFSNHIERHHDLLLKCLLSNQWPWVSSQNDRQQIEKNIGLK